MISQTYVSQSLIDPADRARVMNDILTVSIARNTMLGITGLLIASPDHFAQLVEGPAAGVAAVMASIKTDPRHTGFRLLHEAPLAQTTCQRWRLARFDSDNFGTDIIDPLLMAAHAGTDGRAIGRLNRLIATLANDPALTRSSFLRR